jgi:hypothetical protein
MKIRTSEAATNLAIHPSHLLLHVAELDPSLRFEDVWPEIDEGWVESVSASGGHRRAPVPLQQQALANHPMASSRLSNNAVRVVDKLWRQGKWGRVSVAFEALMNLAHVSKRDLEDVLVELRSEGILDPDHDGTGVGKISLNSGRREFIERIAKGGKSREQPSR